MGDTGASGAIGFFVIVAFFVLTPILIIVFIAACLRGFGRASRPIAALIGLLAFPLIFVCAKLAYDIHHQNKSDNEASKGFALYRSA
jgi:chromate transport protein ChrA